MSNFITTRQLQNLTGHTCDFKFYDNHNDTFDELLGNAPRKPVSPIGTVWECECGARELRFVVWTGKYDNRGKKEIVPQ